MTHQIKNKIVAFTMPKPLENDEDNQDAFCVNQSGTMVAIADGASTGYRQREWAKFLVEYFCKDESSIRKININYSEWLKEPQRRWRDFSLQIQSDPSTPWNQRTAHNRDHASATFVGIKIDPYDQTLNQGTWQAAAVGDSCLFHITQDFSKIWVIPPTVRSSKDFNTTPSVICSLPEKPSSQIIVYPDTHYTKGDFFLLATDALAKWILQSFESGNNKWQKLLSFEKQEEFYTFIENIRSFQSNPKIDIDDTTLCVIKTGVTQTVSTGQESTTSKDTATEPPSNPILTVPQSVTTNPDTVSDLPNNPQSPMVNDNKYSKGGTKTKPISPDSFDMKFGFRLLAFIGVVNLIPYILNLLANLGWIPPIFGFSKPQAGNISQNSPPISTNEPNEGSKSGVTSIERTPLYKLDNTLQPVGFLFNNDSIDNINNESEIEVFIPTPYSYLIQESNKFFLKNIQIIPICKTLPNTESISEICKDNIGYILPNSLLPVDSPTDSFTIYKNGRVVKAKLKLLKKE